MPKLRSSGVIAAILYLVIISVLALIYLRQATAFGTNAPLMPVDDAYIHFQYARQAASGEPFVYNAGQDPSSGATSLLYPLILAIGYKLGFMGFNLGYWATVSRSAVVSARGTLHHWRGVPHWLL